MSHRRNVQYERMLGRAACAKGEADVKRIVEGLRSEIVRHIDRQTTNA